MLVQRWKIDNANLDEKDVRMYFSLKLVHRHSQYDEQSASEYPPFKWLISLIKLWSKATDYIPGCAFQWDRGISNIDETRSLYLQLALPWVRSILKFILKRKHLRFYLWAIKNNKILFSLFKTIRGSSSLKYRI